MADDYWDQPASAKPVAHEPWGEEPPMPASEDDYGGGRVVELRPRPNGANGQHAASGASGGLLPFLATPLLASELENIPPRALIYGHFLFRKFISAIGAPGGAGKTAYAFGVALAIATGNPILGEPVHEMGNVWIYNLEDPRTELLRRFKAALLGHDVHFETIQDRIFLDSGRDRPLIIASALRDGSVIAWPQVDSLIAELRARDVRVLIVDPFVRSHRVEENVNDQVDFVAAQWAMVADAADCSILLVHHFRKGGLSGDAAAFRGASALIDASRAAVTLATMSPEDAGKLGVTEKNRWRYIRLDNAKLNLAPPPENAIWLELTGIDLDNAQDGRKSDNVQTVRPWAAPSPWEGFSMADALRVLELIDAGPSPGEFYALGRQARNRWAGTVIVLQTGKTPEQAVSILKEWRDNGLLEEGQYASPQLKARMTGCVRLNQAKFDDMKRGSQPWRETE